MSANGDRLHQIYQSYGLGEPARWQQTFIQTGHRGQEESSDESVSAPGPPASFRVGKTLFRLAPPHSCRFPLSTWLNIDKTQLVTDRNGLHVALQTAVPRHC